MAGQTVDKTALHWAVRLVALMVVRKAVVSALMTALQWVVGKGARMGMCSAMRKVVKKAAELDTTRACKMAPSLAEMRAE